MALSSITKKLIMSISGLFLIVFMLLHMTINFFSVIDTFKGRSMKTIRNSPLILMISFLVIDESAIIVYNLL